MNSAIFREYDIRGVAGEDMTGADVVSIGKGVGTYLQEFGLNELNVGRDCRQTSEEYAAKVIAGLTATGCNVKDIGVCPTPVFYFSIEHTDRDGGTMVTASHNPKEYNGFKLCSGLDSIHGEQIQQIRNIIEKGAFRRGSGNVSSDTIVPAYQAYLESNINLGRPLRVGVDAGNGTAGVVAVPLLSRLGCEVFDIYCDMDGNFPNHEADPTVAKNMQDLRKLVKTEKLDLGIGYDGDGDRIGVLDENGNMIYGDKLMILFAREILARKPGATFISEVKCSQSMYEDIRKHGGRAVMCKTGHSLIKKKMKEKEAALAGEMSGHIFFADRYFGYDDAIYASCRLLEILSHSEKTLSEFLMDVPQTCSSPEIRVDCPDEIKFDVVKKATDYFRKNFEVIDIDGVRVLFEDGWGLVRASNTQPALVLRYEAKTEDRLKEIQKLIETTLERIIE